MQSRQERCGFQEKELLPQIPQIKAVICVIREICGWFFFSKCIVYRFAPFASLRLCVENSFCAGLEN
jgi:hypothetical protein